jgi:hypothetical protein
VALGYENNDPEDDAEGESATVAVNDATILKDSREGLKLCIDDEQIERAKMADDMRFVSLDQWPQDIRSMRENDSVNGARPCLTVDQINQYTTQVTNDMRANRPSVKTRPVDDKADPATAEVFQGLVRHIEDQSSAAIAYQTSGESAVDIGLGFFRIITDYVSPDSFDQEIIIKRVPNTFSVYLSAHQMPDGSDAEKGWILEKIQIDKFKATYPDAKADKADFTDLGVQPTWYSEQEVTICEYFYKEYKQEKLLFLEDGNTVYKGDYEKLPDPKPQITGQRDSQRVSVKWCKHTGCEILEKRDWPGKFIPIIEEIGKEKIVDGKRILWGLVRPAKDSLRAFNYWISALTEKMALAPKAPFVGAVGQFASQGDKWDKANINNYAKLEYDAIDVNGNVVAAPRRQEPMQMEPAMAQMLQIMQNNVKSSLGMYKASVGQGEGDQSGRAILALKKESDTGTLHFGENQAISIMHGGRIMVDLIPKIYDTKRILRILGEDGKAQNVMIDPEQPQAMREVRDAAGVVQRIYNLGVGKYDVTVTVGPGYTTSRQEAATVLTDLANSAKDSTSAAILRYAAVQNSDFHGSDKITAMLKSTLPPPVLAAVEGQPQIPPQVQAHVQQLEQMLQAATQKIKELASGEAQAQAKIAADAKAAAAAIQLKRDIAVSDEEIAREKVDRDQKLAIEKADLEAATKVTVAQIAAKAGTTQTLIEAEAKANLELSGALIESPQAAMAQGEATQPVSPIKRLTDMHAQHLEAINNLIPAITSGMGAINQKIDNSRPVSIESVRDKTGKLTHGVATYINGEKKTITVN